MRLFVSVDADGLAGEIAAVQRPFADASGLRPTDPRQAHITLKFLGDTPSEQIPDLREAIGMAVTDSCLAPFRTELGGLGVFPGLEYISVVWLGVREGSEQLTTLHEWTARRRLPEARSPPHPSPVAAPDRLPWTGQRTVSDPTVYERPGMSCGQHSTVRAKYQKRCCHRSGPDSDTADAGETPTGAASPRATDTTGTRCGSLVCLG